MTVYLDTSALVSVAVDGLARSVVIEALDIDSDWCSSALSLGEAMAVITRLTDEEVLQNDLEDAVRLLWDRLAVVPVDQSCLDRASRIVHEQPVKIADAIHLAAADRLPRPVTYVTFDPAQIPVALSMGFEVTST
jgi:predicted nucleic acid-binding protein